MGFGSEIEISKDNKIGFNLNSVTEDRQLLTQTHGENASAIKICEYWFRYFKSEASKLCPIFVTHSRELH